MGRGKAVGRGVRGVVALRAGQRGELRLRCPALREGASLLTWALLTAGKGRVLLWASCPSALPRVSLLGFGASGAGAAPAVGRAEPACARGRVCRAEAFPEQAQADNRC